jgi:hypothetical protein
MTYAREKYNRTNICLGSDYVEDISSESCKARPSSNLSPAGKRTGQDNNTKYLLGNDRSSFYKKSVDSNLGVPAEFIPKYKQQSAFDRKQNEFNDGFSPKREERVLQDQDIYLTAKDRRLGDQVSIFDSNNYERPAREVRKEPSKPPVYNPNMRKSENLSSDVFQNRQVHEFRRPEAVAENDDARRKNHNYSDLFGRAASPSKLPSNPSDPCKSHQNKSDYDPRGQGTRMLSSQIDIGDSPRRSTRARTPNIQEKPRFQDFTSSGQRKQEELSTSFASYRPSGPSANAEVVDLDLFAVPAEVAAADVKDLCGGVHLVSLALDIDNFTGKCRGTGKLRLRTSNPQDLARVRRVFAAKGIQVEKKVENVGRKNNYADVAGVNWHNSHEVQRNFTPLGARHSKMKNLESQVLGGGKKWVDQQVESFDGELSAQILWKNTKNPRGY